MKLNNRYLSMLDNFVFHIVSYGRNDEELHVTQDGATPHLVLRVRMCL